MTNRKPNITHVAYSGLGGHGNVFFSMVAADRNKDYRYTAVFNGIEPVKEEYVIKSNQEGIQFEYVGKKRGLDIGFFFNLYRAFKKVKPDIIFLHGPLAILPAFFYRVRTLFKCKIVVRETEPNHLKTRQDWFWLYVAMFLSNRILFLSEQFMIDVKKRMGIFFNRKKTGVIPNGIDLTLFNPAEATQQSKTPFIIGMQSRLERSKDHKTLLQAFAILKEQPFFSDLRLRIAGDGTLRGELEELSDSLQVKNNVEFCGMLKETELVSFLKSLDLYIHASTGETMSTAIMQAMACRLPVIASDVKGINNMVTNGYTGVLVPVANSDDLGKAIIYMYNNESVRGKMASNAYHTAVEKFSNNRMFNQYKDVFNNI